MQLQLLLGGNTNPQAAWLQPPMHLKVLKVIPETSSNLLNAEATF
jgi:hypothetical protein